MRVLLIGVLAVLCSISLSAAASCGSDGKGIWNSDQTICCPKECRSCGGTGCGKRFKNSASKCCQGDVLAANKQCGVAPCVKQATCAAGTGIFSADKKACCAAKCGKCGGKGCSARSGGTSACCQDAITAANKQCGSAPCVIKKAPTATTPAPTAKPPQFLPVTCDTAGGKLSENGDTCCDKSCAVCSSEVCANNKAGPCCSGYQKKICGDPGVKAPCQVNYTTKPTPECPYPCGRNTVFRNVYTVSNTPDTTCCKGDQRCYTAAKPTDDISQNIPATSCQSPIKCNTAAGESACGESGGFGTSYPANKCCTKSRQCVFRGGQGSGRSDCEPKAP